MSLSTARVRRFLGSACERVSRLAVGALVLALSFDAHACTVCWGNPDDPMVQGANSGIWVLLAIIAFVQLGFVALFWSFWRRARDQRRFRESLRVIHPFDPVDRSVNQGGIRS